MSDDAQLDVALQRLRDRSATVRVLGDWMTDEFVKQGADDVREDEEDREEDNE